MVGYFPRKPLSDEFASSQSERDLKIAISSARSAYTHSPKSSAGLLAQTLYVHNQKRFAKPTDLGKAHQMINSRHVKDANIPKAALVMQQSLRATILTALNNAKDDATPF